MPVHLPIHFNCLTKRVRRTDTTDRATMIRDHLSTMNFPSGVRAVAAECMACTLWLVRYLLMLVWSSCGLCTNMSSCRGVVTPFVGRGTVARSVLRVTALLLFNLLSDASFAPFTWTRVLPAPAQARSSGCFDRILVTQWQVVSRVRERPATTTN